MLYYQCRDWACCATQVNSYLSVYLLLFGLFLLLLFWSSILHKTKAKHIFFFFWMCKICAFCHFSNYLEYIELEFGLNVIVVNGISNSYRNSITTTVGCTNSEVIPVVMKQYKQTKQANVWFHELNKVEFYIKWGTKKGRKKLMNIANKMYQI